MKQTKGVVFEGFTVDPDGVHWPTLVIETDSDLADEGMTVALQAATALPARLAALGVATSPPEYGARLFGCMQCSASLIIVAPIPALGNEVWACPYCGPDAAVPIGEVFTPDDVKG